MDESGQLEMLESQLEASSLTSKKEISCRISVCETEMDNLKRRIEEMVDIIEEEYMQAKRGRNTG